MGKIKDAIAWLIWNINFLWEDMDHGYGSRLKWHWVAHIFVWSEGGLCVKCNPPKPPRRVEGRIISKQERDPLIIDDE